jgi:NADP-dependent 3-hydroxy acid dehydrogenase YdfG
MYFTLMKNQHYDEWEQTIDTNCKGVVNLCGAVLPHMLSASTGHIINISSDAARTIFPALAVYNASKAFVNIFTKGLRAECVGTGLRVTDVQPGDVATNLIMKNSDQEAADKVGVAIGKVVGDGADKASVLDASDVADVVVFAATAPAHVGMHEVLVEPRDQMFGDPTAMNS